LPPFGLAGQGRHAFVGGLPVKKVIVSLDFSYSFYRDLWRGIVRYAYEHTHWSLWPVGWQSLRTNRSVAYDGFIGFINSNEEGEQLRQLVPAAVNISNRGSCRTVPSILNDDIGGGRMAAEYFIGKGFRVFGFIGYPELTYSKQRQQGFADAVRAAGLPIQIYDNDQQSLADWLRSLPVATAIFSANDVLAFRITRKCWELDIHIPQQLALLGCDNDETYCQSGIIGMSSIMLASETLGYRAAELLHRQLEGEAIDSANELVPPLNIITRLSTDMQAVRDELVRRALRFIQNNVHTNFQVEDLLAHLHVGRRTLERKFKESLGHSPHYAINRARVEMAKRLLETTNFKMDDIAVRCGFSEARILYRNFRLITGESPAKYREHFH
jgi:LacI family transcriptional regulator